MEPSWRGHPSAGLRVTVLGRLGVEVGGDALPLRGDRRRALLAALFLGAGRTLAVGDLVTRVWGVSSNQANRSALQVHVARARALFDAHCGRPLILGGDGGYRIELDETESDLLTFRSLVRQADAADTPEGRTDLLVHALGLWRGPVLGDVTSPVLHARDVAPLNEELLRVAEAGFGAALERGDHEEVARRVASVVADHPEREPLARIHMVALYRSGRSSEALRVYARTRAVLAERLGADPGRELRETFHGILRGDLDRVPRVPRPRALGGPDAAGREGTARPARGADPPEPGVVPAELPAAVVPLVGRDRALAELDRLVDPCALMPGSVLVRGPAGAGSSALAVRWAHGAAAHFPDGQLYVNLRGEDGRPYDPAEALRRLLRSLTGGAEVPDGLGTDEVAARARTLTARRRVLLVLDNAVSARQVRPLLPGGTGCAAVVTSRHWLTDLLVRDGLRVLPVGALAREEAVALLESLVAPERRSGEGLERLAQLAGCLPLPLRMAVAWLDTRPDRSVDDLVRAVEGVDPAHSGTPAARMAAVLRAGPGEGRRGRGEVPAGPGPPATSLRPPSYAPLSPG
ncbi:AfsR/SARP family transcriptional regulator [Nocardiopsis sp. FIRDI 009]|uniref:AfsR/SARP family transcriptional regulator n=1 Tax=Nocardiopsis sp. FIRDI 009 TaxID=714197 RepID=UPI001E3AA9BE|nr:AfsR/SARP family transcriptional regulator [Nocardiopsis sp. FIRDI 009]